VLAVLLVVLATTVAVVIVVAAVPALRAVVGTAGTPAECVSHGGTFHFRGTAFGEPLHETSARVVLPFHAFFSTTRSA
jgi:hypothetical protein